MKNENEALLIEYRDRIEELMADLTSGADRTEIKLKAKQLKAELKADRDLDHSISEAYLHFPNLGSNPDKANWHTSFYDANIDLNHSIFSDDDD